MPFFPGTGVNAPALDTSVSFLDSMTAWALGGESGKRPRARYQTPAFVTMHHVSY